MTSGSTLPGPFGGPPGSPVGGTLRLRLVVGVAPRPPARGVSSALRGGRLFYALASTQTILTRRNSRALGLCDRAVFSRTRQSDGNTGTKMDLEVFLLFQYAINVRGILE